MTIGRLKNDPVPVPTTRHAIKMEAIASCIFLSVEAFGALSMHILPIYPFESENKLMINIKSASLLNRILCPSSVGMLQNINNGIKANRNILADNTTIFPRMVRPGNLIHVAKYLPRKSPTLNNKKTVTGVKYLADHSEFDFLASD